MTDVVVPFSGAAMRCRQFAAAVGGLLHKALVAYETRRALSELPDDLLRDIGVNRSEIPFVADTLAAGGRDPSRHALDQVNRSVTGGSEARRNALARELPHAALFLAVAAAITLCAFAAGSSAIPADDTEIARQMAAAICIGEK